MHRYAVITNDGTNNYSSPYVPYGIPAAVPATYTTFASPKVTYTAPNMANAPIVANSPSVVNAPSMALKPTMYAANPAANPEPFFFDNRYFNNNLGGKVFIHRLIHFICGLIYQVALLVFNFVT